MSSDRLASVRKKIERGGKHFKDLNEAMRSFIATNPYALAGRQDLQTRRYEIYISKITPPPDEIIMLAADAIHNYRCGLDHLATLLIMSGIGSSIAPRHGAFPIFRNATEYSKESPRKTRGMSPAAIKAIDEIEPYQGGKGHQLWILHELDNTDKHRLILAAFANFGSVKVPAPFSPEMRALLKQEGVPPLGIHLRPANPKFPAEVGDVVIGNLPELEMDIEAALCVSLAEPQIAAPEPLMETIQRFDRSTIDTFNLLAPLV